MKQQIYSTNLSSLNGSCLKETETSHYASWESHPDGRMGGNALQSWVQGPQHVVQLLCVYVCSSDYVQLPEVLSSQWSYQVWFYSAFSETEICERKPKEIGILRSLTPLAALWSNVVFFMSENLFWLFSCMHTRTHSHVCKQTIYMIMSMVSCYSTDLQVMVMCHSAMHYQKQGRRYVQVYHWDVVLKWP